MKTINLFYIGGKAMKKKIIFILSFLTMVLCFTGCSTEVTPEKIREITNIAQNIKNNSNYQVPEGYTYKYTGNSPNTQLIIKTKEESNRDHDLILTFDTTKEKVQLLNIELNYDYDLFLAVGLMLILCFISFSIGAAVWRIK